jgi:hypothetical protein
MIHKIRGANLKIIFKIDDEKLQVGCLKGRYDNKNKSERMELRSSFLFYVGGSVHQLMILFLTGYLVFEYFRQFYIKRFFVFSGITNPAS